MIEKKTTLQTARMIQEGAKDDILKSRYGTSVDEYISREHAKEMKNQIHALRESFKIMNKEKNSSLTLNDLTEYFQKTNVI